MAEIMIKTDGLTKMYGGLCAVNNVSITVEKGAIVGLVGKNGAGKTTLIRILTGLVAPTSGTYSIMPDQQRKNTSVAAIVERPSIYTDMNAMDNLTLQCHLLDIPVDREYLTKTLEIVGLQPDNKQKARNYSLGMKQRLAIAMTLVGKPELMIMDEPTNGLDPEGMHDVRELLVKLNRSFGTTIVVSSHILAELNKFATEYFFMDNGRIISHVSAEDLEKAVAKRLKITVSDVEKAMAALAPFGKVEQSSEHSVELYGEVPPTQAMLVLSQAGVTVFNIINVGDNLEEYFIGLVGGAK